MKQHKWHKEIKAWADGKEIEVKWLADKNTEWECVVAPNWDATHWEYRIKPQHKEEDWVMICKKCGDELGIVYEPKEPQYLYVYEDIGGINITSDKNYATKDMEYIGKIKLEVENE
jgi:hypothetical protein